MIVTGARKHNVIVLQHLGEEPTYLKPDSYGMTSQTLGYHSSEIYWTFCITSSKYVFEMSVRPVARDLLISQVSTLKAYFSREINIITFQGAILDYEIY